MKYSLILLFILFLNIGCSSKSQLSPKLDTNVTTTQDNDIDEFDNEFGDETKEVFDPLEGYNRFMTNVNDKIYTYAFNPISKGYAFITPKPIRSGISNAFDNLKFPIRFVNNILQLKFDNSIKELGRFMINSTVGVFGLFDVAKAGGVEPHNEDFGQTLGFYNIPSGPHIVLPFLGPSNLRDTIGLSFDAVLDPKTIAPIKYDIPNNREKALGVSALYYVNKNSLHLGEYENLKKDALDVYTFFRDAYEQKRAKEIAE